MNTEHIKIRLQRWVVNVSWPIRSTNLKIYFFLLWFQRREESIVPRASNMAEEHPGMADWRSQKANHISASLQTFRISFTTRALSFLTPAAFFVLIIHHVG